MGFLLDMAPEVGLNSVNVSIGYGRPADIYSFSILLWQLLAKEKPFREFHSAEEFERRVFIGGTRPGLGSQWPGPVCSLIKCCWEADPKWRPSMVNVKASLTDILQNCSGPAATTKTRSPVNLTRLAVSGIETRAGCGGLVKNT